jgi:hypothetical protein
VCYENSVNCTLVCGHKFCKSCVKTWYLKSASDDSGCPMCRRKVHYRRMPVKRWREEAEESKKTDLYQESFDDLLEGVMEPIVFDIFEEDCVPKVNLNKYIPVSSGDKLIIYKKNVRLTEFVELEKTFRAIKDECTLDELDYVLNDTGDYYSDRHIHLKNRTYSENGHRYPPLKRNDNKMIRNARRS